ncbi:MAG: hypothetical protein HC880_18265 [Bacteroidia bacterium]|nr:hypothetical protein [Bacteroidia bacterium]
MYRGFRNCIWRDLKNKRTIIVLCNRQIGGQMVPIVEAIDAILQSKKCKFPKATAVEKSSLTRFKESFWINYFN